MRYPARPSDRMAANMPSACASGMRTEFIGVLPRADPVTGFWPLLEAQLRTRQMVKGFGLLPCTGDTGDLAGTLSQGRASFLRSDVGGHRG